MLFDWDADGWQSFVSDPEVPPIMKEAGHKGPPQAPSSAANSTPSASRDRRKCHGSTTARPIKVGVIADQTGPLDFMGIADANVAKMVIDEINAGGGLLGRRIELHLTDSETTDEAAAACATKLVQEGVDVIFGGIFSSTRQAIKGPLSWTARRSTSTPSSTRERSPTR